MITIDLKLFVTLSKYHPGEGDHLEVSDKTSVESLIADLGIPKELVKLIFINGKREDSSYRLRQGDRLGLFPPVGGG